MVVAVQQRILGILSPLVILPLAPRRDPVHLQTRALEHDDQSTGVLLLQRRLGDGSGSGDEGWVARDRRRG
jgi:hypothetical protein